MNIISLNLIGVNSPILEYDYFTDMPTIRILVCINSVYSVYTINNIYNIYNIYIIYNYITIIVIIVGHIIEIKELVSYI